MASVPRLRRSNPSSFLIPASRPGLLTAASSRLVRESLAALCLDRVGKDTRREAPAGNSHARKRVVRRQTEPRPEGPGHWNRTIHSHVLANRRNSAARFSPPAQGRRAASRYCGERSAPGAPGGGYPFAASSRTRTQSRCSPGFGSDEMALISRQSTTGHRPFPVRAENSWATAWRDETGPGHRVRAFPARQLPLPARH